MKSGSSPMKFYFIFLAIYLIVNMCTMVLTLISSTVVLHIHSIKHKPVPQWVENSVRPLAYLLCVGTESKANSEGSITNEHRPLHNTDGSNEIDKKSTSNEMVKIWKQVITSKSTNEEHDRFKKTNGSKLENDPNFKYRNRDWTWCAKVVERMFLVIWLVAYMASVVLLAILSASFHKEWESL